MGMTGSAAYAQSSVTLYGIVDGSLLYTSHTMNMQTGQNAGHQFSFTDSGMTGSSFGMRGAEDLGGGMRAVFMLESGISVANGQFGNSNGNLFGRQAWVGLDSSYGSLKAGLQYSPFFLSLYDTDPRGMSYFGSALVSYVNNVYVTGLFNSNSITYTSPEIWGVQASGMFAFGGAAGDFQAGRQYSASLRYHLGGLTLSGALYDGNAGGTAATTPVPSTVEFVGRTLGASYRFENSLTISASYALYKVAHSFDNSVYSGGLSYFVTPYLDVNAGVYYTRDGNEGANHSILASSGVQFFLSKRTTLYGQVGYVNNHGRMDTGLSINNALFEVSGSTVGASIGIRHMF
ncbi:porin [Paraburkholderia pallida]|uniref:Porin n=2 Tax=Paraburkholderia pallida TaxID=2547399 RepID=A0A4P7DA88_9BURK|nr:porin [Paraburkholderia pallida]QBR03804.1 porin [Paraburkholderia pallida]